MWRPAVVRFGVLASLAVVACGGGSKGGAGSETTIGNRSALSASDSSLAAQYWCSIRNGEFEYPQMPCVIEQQGDGRFVLAKLAGSQRFRGVVKPRGDGFTFDGEFYCPWGDCTKPLRGVFKSTGDGRLRGTFDDDASLVVTLTRAPANGGGFGGAGYGGAAYGGFGYGGWGYGGSSYGNARPMPPPSF